MTEAPTINAAKLRVKSLAYHSQFLGLSEAARIDCERRKDVLSAVRSALEPLQVTHDKAAKELEKKSNPRRRQIEMGVMWVGAAIVGYFGGESRALAWTGGMLAVFGFLSSVVTLITHRSLEKDLQDLGHRIAKLAFEWGASGGTDEYFWQHLQRLRLRSEILHSESDQSTQNAKWSDVRDEIANDWINVCYLLLVHKYHVYCTWTFDLNDVQIPTEVASPELDIAEAFERKIKELRQRPLVGG